MSLKYEPSLEQVNYAMAISPVAMIPDALPLATLQQMYYQGTHSL